MKAWMSWKQWKMKTSDVAVHRRRRRVTNVSMSPVSDGSADEAVMAATPPPAPASLTFQGELPLI